MHSDLFGDPFAAATPAARPGAGRNSIEPAAPDAATLELASAMPPGVCLGTSSWSFPGWADLVYAKVYPESALSKHGLSAYAQHPLLRCVSLDRSFYRPLSQAQFAALRAQTQDRNDRLAPFRFVVKAPASLCDATVRDATGRGVQTNPQFLNPELAWLEALEPAARGLGDALGALVFQVSPLPHFWQHDTSQPTALLDAMLEHLNAQHWRQWAPSAVLAVEVRNPAWVLAGGPALARVLKRHGATYCLGLHAKMPPLKDQLPMLRALWPGPLVARWSLHSQHGAYGYQAAKNQYEPFDQLIDPDPTIRDGLAKVIAATARAGHQVLVTINNKAEGSAPRSVSALAQAVVDQSPP